MSAGPNRAAKLRALRDAWKARALRSEAREAQLAAEVERLKGAITLPGSHRWAPGVERWRGLVHHFMAVYGGDRYNPAVDLDVMLGIMAHVSGGDPLSVCRREWVGVPPPGYDPGDDSTKASGLFDQLPPYWEGRARAAAFEGRGIFDVEANVGVACWLLWDGWHAGSAPNWQHWSGAHVGVEGSYEWALRQIAQGAS